jgi:hypothetical protein
MVLRRSVNSTSHQPTTNWCNAQICQHKVNIAKDAVLFHQHSGDILVHILDYSFCTENHIWHIFSNKVAIKSIEYYLRKSCSA